MSISPLKEAILRALANYKYLSLSHFVKLGLSKSIPSLGHELRRLRSIGLTGRLTNSSVSETFLKQGIKRQIKNEDLHYLTKKGAKFLSEVTELPSANIRYPKRQKLRLSNDYFHRVSTISAHISINHWLDKMNFTLLDVLLYYDKRSKFKDVNSTIESRVKRANNETKTPDLVFGYSTPNKKHRVFILEVYNGSRKGYIHSETVELFETLQETTELSDRLGVRILPRVLITCNTLTNIHNAITEIKNDTYFDFANIGEVLFFNTDENIWSNFGDNWINLYGESVNLEEII